MYVIVVYDVNVERVNRVKKFLRRYLNWVQNSVFEGELTPADLEEVRMGLKDIINENEDMVVIYRLKSNKGLGKEILGIDKGGDEQVI